MRPRVTLSCVLVTDFKPVSCPVCHKEFSRKYHLVRHNMQTGCDGSERPTFPCQVRCSSKIDSKFHLPIHSGGCFRIRCNKWYTIGSGGFRVGSCFLVGGFLSG